MKTKIVAMMMVLLATSCDMFYTSDSEPQRAQDQYFLDAYDLTQLNGRCTDGRIKLKIFVVNDAEYVGTDIDEYFDNNKRELLMRWNIRDKRGDLIAVNYIYCSHDGQDKVGY